MKRMVFGVMIPCLVSLMFHQACAGRLDGIMPGNTRGYDFGEGAFNKARLMESFRWSKPYNLHDPALPPDHLEDAPARRVAGEKLHKAILDAADAWMRGAGPNVFTIPSGVYRMVDQYGAISLKGVTNFTIKAAPNVFIYMEPSQKTVRYELPLIFLQQCEQVTIIGDPATRLIGDCIPFNSTQGRVTAVDASDRNFVTLTVDVMPGYVGYEGDLLDYHGMGHECCYTMFDEKGARLRNVMISTRNIAPVSRNTYRITVCSGTYNDFNLIDELFKPGHYISLRFDMKFGVNLRFCGHISIENVAYYGGDHFVNEHRSTGANVFRNCRGARREGSGRLMGVGGSQQTYVTGAPVYDYCEFGYSWDDLLNICSWATAAYRQESPRKVLVFPKGGEGTDTFVGTEGKRVAFYDFDTKVKRDSGRIVSAETVRDPKLIEAFNAAMSSKNMVPMWGVGMVRLTFDKAMNVKIGDVLQIEDRQPSDLIIRNSYFHDANCRVLINGTERVIMENCVLERNSLPSVSVEMSTYWMEGATACDMIFKDNLIIDGRYGPFGSGPNQPGMAAFCVTAEVPKDAPIGYTHQRLEIVNNVFVDSDYASILVQRTKDVNISGNTFINTGCQRYKAHDIPGSAFFGEDPTSAVYLDSVQNVIIEKNDVLETNAQVNTIGNAFKIGKRNPPDADIVIRNNRINGVPQTVDRVQGRVPVLPDVSRARPAVNPGR